MFPGVSGIRDLVQHDASVQNDSDGWDWIKRDSHGSGRIEGDRSGIAYGDTSIADLDSQPIGDLDDQERCDYRHKDHHTDKANCNGNGNSITSHMDTETSIHVDAEASADCNATASTGEQRMSGWGDGDLL